MEGGFDPQRYFDHRETEFDIPPQHSKGGQLGATLSESMMSEPIYTARPSSQPSSIEPPHAQTSAHQAPYTPDHASWMDLAAQISSLGTRMEELAVVIDTGFYSMEDRMGHYQIGFIDQFECLQQRFQTIEDRMDQQQTTFEHILRRLDRQESQHEDMMAYLRSVFPPPPSQP